MGRCRWTARALAAVTVTTLGASLSAAQHAPTPAPGRDPRLARQLEEVRRATARFHEVREAERAGYRLLAGAMDGPLMGEHWVNRDLLRQPLDLTRPAVLQYARVGERRVLVGVAYGQLQRPGEPMPEGFVGGDDHWHAHDLEALAQLGAAQGSRPWALMRRAAARRGFADGGRSRVAMVHAWVWSENPDGVFANQNRAIPYLRAGLPLPASAGAAPGAAWAAARGVDLLAPGGCTRVSQAAERFLQPTREQRRRIERACAQARARVQAAAHDPGRLQVEAAAAFADFARTARAELTPQQRARARQIAAQAGEMPVPGAHPH